MLVSVTGCVNHASGSADGIIRLTPAAEAALEKHEGKSWLISHNGLCAGAPALGLYLAGDDAPADAVPVSAGGSAFLVERKVMECVAKWGVIHVESPGEGIAPIRAHFAIESDPAPGRRTEKLTGKE